MGRPRKQLRNQQKECARCKCWKQLSAFTINRLSSDGHNSYCRECARLTRRESYLRNRSQQLNAAKAYYKRNRTRMLQNGKAFRQKHRKRLRAYHRQWREQHRERLQQQAQECYRQNKGEINHRWRERNPDKVRITNQRSAQKQRDTLSDSYILHLLTKRSGLSRKNIPAELIAAKRQELECERVARKMLSELHRLIYET